MLFGKFKFLFFLVFIALNARSAASEKEALESINFFKNNFRMIDSKGHAQSLFQYKTKEQVFLISYGSGKKSGDIVYKYMNRILKKSSNNAVLWINSSFPQNRALVNQEIESDSTQPVLMDFSQTVSKSLNFKNVGDILVLNPKNWGVSFRGHIFDDNFKNFLNSINLLKNDNKVYNFFSFVPNFKNEFIKSNDSKLNYENFTFVGKEPLIRKLLFTNCVNCHMQSKQTNYFKNVQDFINKSAMNRKLMRMYEMPAGGVDYDSDNLCTTRHVGKVNENELSLLLNWFDQGAPYSSSDIMDKKYFLKEYQNRFVNIDKEFKPDLEWISKKDNVSTPDGKSFTVAEQIAGPLQEDLNFDAIRLITNQSTTHHVSLYFSQFPINKIFKFGKNGEVLYELDRKNGSENKKYEQAFVFGRTTNLNKRAPEGTLFFIPKNSYIFTITHISPNGRYEINKLHFFIKKSKKNIKMLKRVRFDSVGMQKFEIKPNQSDFKINLDYAFKKDTHLISSFAHMHYRGMGYKIELIDPRDKKTLLCNVPFFQLKAEFQSMNKCVRWYT